MRKGKLDPLHAQIQEIIDPPTKKVTILSCSIYFSQSHEIMKVIDP